MNAGRPRSSPVAETLFEIKQRYEDTSLVLFKERQHRPRPISFLSVGDSKKSYAYACYGNTAVVVQRRGKEVCLIGGADPSGTHGDVHTFDLKTNNWTEVNFARTGHEFKRYEFSVAYVGGSEICVFGGSDENGNHNDTHTLLLEDSVPVCKPIQCKGDCPSPRTQHCSSASLDGHLIVFGGGLQAAEPVPDRSVYVLDVKSATWWKVRTEGSAPEARQGHVMVTAPNPPRLFVQGGMAGTVFYDDLHVLEFDPEYKSATWSKISDGGNGPRARAGHGGVMYGNCLCVFGGLGETGALGDLWKYDTDCQVWTEIPLQGAFPSPRLDFALCLVTLNEDASLFLHGGMDTCGNVFDDAYLCLLGRP